MKKYEISFLIQGPARTEWCPNSQNPVLCGSMEEVLRNLAANPLQLFGGCKTIGIRILEIE